VTLQLVKRHAAADSLVFAPREKPIEIDATAHADPRIF